MHLEPINCIIIGPESSLSQTAAKLNRSMQVNVNILSRALFANYSPYASGAFASAEIALSVRKVSNYLNLIVGHISHMKEGQSSYLMLAGLFKCYLKGK